MDGFTIIKNGGMIKKINPLDNVLETSANNTTVSGVQNKQEITNGDGE